MHQFDRDILFKAGEPFSFSGQIADNWSINGVPDGGYLMAILTKAMMRHSEMKSTPIITANFLNRCEPGDASVTIEKMATSKQFDRFQGSLSQKGKEKIRAFGTFAIENKECLVERCESSGPEIAELEKCVAVPEIPNYTLFGQLDLRLDPICTGWMLGKLSDTSEIKGWIKFKNDRPFDVLSILLIADSFPPAVISSQGMVAWVPTIELSVNVRKLPTTDWLKCSFRTRFITCGLLEEDGEIWDQKGELIAISRQIAQYRAPST
ncbi:MAG: thioesterase family protein [Desulfobacterales bacterium]